ncbi:MAG: hypothetical protein Q7S81_02580 [bacterium]|nr:hypothetical protein [bacterium]
MKFLYVIFVVFPSLRVPPTCPSEAMRRRKQSTHICHSGLDPESRDYELKTWIPAFAGMTNKQKGRKMI